MQGVGAALVKNPSPYTGGNCAGSPSTRIGLPNDIRSSPRVLSTIEHSSTISSTAKHSCAYVLYFSPHLTPCLAGARPKRAPLAALSLVPSRLSHSPRPRYRGR